ncbi:hypothetical protein PP744_gp027 [Rhizobium phage RHph_N38]|uniref:Uncharacterized protein n=1 Tax=Rhizobium phage RHph_N38 TaxID=2509750 RepID=A0A7S5R3L6_9CAUD|nr:hypothetical protein PP744_gp027 [Rhizobium phage RHph_N38]QIG70490.1 hypothetical protein EVB89_027 [Rhizobium phage RHph_N38]
MEKELRSGVDLMDTILAELNEVNDIQLAKIFECVTGETLRVLGPDQFEIVYNVKEKPIRQSS